MSEIVNSFLIFNKNDEETSKKKFFSFSRTSRIYTAAVKKSPNSSPFFQSVFNFGVSGVYCLSISAKSTLD